ncbi:MAG: 5-formyltetrahydrofolate cyclo-ligase [Thermoplasmatota archaeon]
MASLRERKQRIRKQVLSQRNSLSAFEVLSRSNRVLENLYAMEAFQDAGLVLSYISFGTEVNTHGCIRLLLEAAEKQVLVPVVASRKARTLVLSELHDWNELSTGAYGILEPGPEYVRERNPGDVDIALVPGVAFDRRGNRVGYGGGYYDGLLRRITGAAVALAYGFQVLDTVPYESHDVRVDAITTEDRMTMV